MRYLLLVVVFALSACARAPLTERIATKDTGYVCTWFAHYVFEGETTKAIAHRQVMRDRGLDSDPDCRMAYEARMVSLTARPQRRVPWEVAVGQ